MAEAKMKKAEAKGTVTVTLIHSGLGRLKNQRQTLVGLGLNKMHRTRTLEDTPAVRGMIETVKHLVRIEDSATQKESGQKGPAEKESRL